MNNDFCSDFPKRASASLTELEKAELEAREVLQEIRQQIKMTQKHISIQEEVLKLQEANHEHVSDILNKIYFQKNVFKEILKRQEGI